MEIRKIMKKLLLLLLCVPVLMNAQTIEEIKSSDKYIWGESTARSLRKADKGAIDDLISQISVSVQSEFSMIVQEQGDDLKEYCEGVIQTYSSATLQNALRKVIEGDNEVKVIRYILKEDRNKIFEGRKNKIIDYAMSGFDAEDEGRLGDALKYYYWSFVLLRSHPDNNTLRYDFNGRGERLLLTSLPDRLNRIFSGLSISVLKQKAKKIDKTILTEIKFRNEKVQNIDYIFYTGDDWSSITSARDGLGVVEYFGEYSKVVDKIRMRIEYEYVNKSNIDKELQEAIDVAYVPFFKSSEISIPLVDIFADEESEIKEVKQQIVESRGGFFAEGLDEADFTRNIETAVGPEIKNNSLEANNSVINKDSLKKVQTLNLYRNMVRKVCTAIELDMHDSIRPYFNNDGWSVYKKLIEYGDAKVLDNGAELKALTVNNQTFIRSVPMRFSFKKNSRKFIENISFTFNDNNHISDVTFSLSEKSVNDILRKSARFANEEEKALLINFMESYKTAYCLGRADYLNQIFADDALIIVGRVLKKTQKIDGIYQNMKNDDIEYIRVNKNDYIARLRRVFKSNEFVNIQFEDNIVKKARADSKVYGIQIKQSYYSTNYGDVGYLFLMIDLDKIQNPKIWVRTWQPQKNADGSIYGLENFSIN